MFELRFIKLATLAQQPTANWQMGNENGKWKIQHVPVPGPTVLGSAASVGTFPWPPFFFP